MARGKVDHLDANLRESMGVGVPAIALVPAGVAGDMRHAGVRRSKNTQEIPVGRIVADPDQPRRTFAEEELRLLSDSLRRLGQLQAITVRWVGSRGTYVVIAGERRWRAARMAGLETLRCEVSEDTRTEAEILEDQLVENALREDLKPIEQAQAFDRLLKLNGWTFRELGEKLNLNKATISKTLSLLELDPSIQEQVDGGVINQGTAYEVARIADKDVQVEVAERAVREGLRTSDVAEIIQAKLRRKPARVPRVFRVEGGFRVTISGPIDDSPGNLVEVLRDAMRQAAAAAQLAESAA